MIIIFESEKQWLIKNGYLEDDSKKIKCCYDGVPLIEDYDDKNQYQIFK